MLIPSPTVIQAASEWTTITKTISQSINTQTYAFYTTHS